MPPILPSFSPAGSLATPPITMSAALSYCWPSLIPVTLKLGKLLPELSQVLKSEVRKSEISTASQ